MGGAPGNSGKNGENGMAGAMGAPGEDGGSGEKGITGLGGGAGYPGNDGMTGYPGAAGGKGPAGIAGIGGFGGAAGASGGRGPRGPTGRAGPAGMTGESGAPGGKGPKGWRGLQGPTGQEGEQGPPGEQGLGGLKGPVGPVGLQGPPGRNGPEGPSGEIGAPGPVGTPGYAGERGRPGESGLPGPPGARGPPGPPANPFSSEYFARVLPFVRKEFTKDSSSEEAFPMGYFQLKYYRSVQDNSNTKAALTMFNLLDVLDIKAESEKKPDGSKFFPAKSCSDIQMCFPESKNGDYWLDPNGGAKTDAFKVYCDFSKNPVETCVRPTTSFQGQEWNKPVNKEFNWIGQDLEAESGQVMYEPRPTQWNSLRLDHTRARQNVTYNCKNSNAYRTIEGAKHTFVKFLASDSQEVTAFGKRNKMEVLKDDCHMKDNTWRETVFELDTSSLDKVPIRDMAVSGADESDEFYSVEMGSVCFY